MAVQNWNVQQVRATEGQEDVWRPQGPLHRSPVPIPCRKGEAHQADRLGREHRIAAVPGHRRGRSGATCTSSSTSGGGGSWGRRGGVNKARMWHGLQLCVCVCAISRTIQVHQSMGCSVTLRSTVMHMHCYQPACFSLCFFASSVCSVDGGWSQQQMFLFCFCFWLQQQCLSVSRRHIACFCLSQVWAMVVFSIVYGYWSARDFELLTGRMCAFVEITSIAKMPGTNNIFLQLLMDFEGWEGLSWKTSRWMDVSWFCLVFQDFTFCFIVFPLTNHHHWCQWKMAFVEGWPLLRGNNNVFASPIANSGQSFQRGGLYREGSLLRGGTVSACIWM